MPKQERHKTAYPGVFFVVGQRIDGKSAERIYYISYAGLLASSGQVDLYTLQKLMTHKSPAMTQRYAHLRDEALQAVANVANDILAQAGNKVQSLKI